MFAAVATSEAWRLAERPLQARRPHRAGQADPFRLIDLAQRGPGRADQEE
jgi:hypothetical protein